MIRWSNCSAYLQCLSDPWGVKLLGMDEQAQFLHDHSEKNMSPCWFCRVSGMEGQDWGEENVGVPEQTTEASS